jgi:hypothetical protein
MIMQKALIDEVSRQDLLTQAINDLRAGKPDLKETPE